MPQATSVENRSLYTRCGIEASGDAVRPSKAWLKPIGSSDWRLDPNWVEVAPRELQWVDFPDQGKPTVAVDDFLVYYATGYGRIFGIVKMFTPPSLKPEGGRWPWEARIRVGLIVKNLERCPELASASVAGRDLRNSIAMGAGHVQLREAEWEAAVGSLRAAYRSGEGDLKDDWYLP
jgi:hypothetical protein